MKRIYDKSNDKDDSRQDSSSRNSGGRRSPSSLLEDSDVSKSSSLSVVQSAQHFRRRKDTKKHRGQRPLEPEKDDSSDFEIGPPSPFASTFLHSSESLVGREGSNHFRNSERNPRVSFFEAVRGSGQTDSSTDRSQHDKSQHQLANSLHTPKDSARDMVKSKSTTRTYVNPNFLSRTTSEIGIPTMSSDARVSNVSSQNSILLSNSGRKSVNFNELLKPKLARSPSRASAGSDTERNVEIDKENYKRPGSCMCTKCGKIIKPENSLLPNENSRRYQIACQENITSRNSPRIVETQGRDQRSYELTSRNTYTDKRYPQNRVNCESATRNVHEHIKCKCCPCSKTVSDPPITNTKRPPVMTGQNIKPIENKKEMKTCKELTKPQQLQPLHKSSPPKSKCQCKTCSNKRCNQRSHRDRNLAGQSIPREAKSLETIDTVTTIEPDHSMENIPGRPNKASGCSLRKKQKSSRSLFASAVTILSGGELNRNKEVCLKDSSKPTPMLVSEDKVICQSSSSQSELHIIVPKSCSCKLEKAAQVIANESHKKCGCKLDRMKNVKEKSSQTSNYDVPKINDCKQNLHRYSRTCLCSICTDRRKCETSKNDLNPSTHEHLKENCNCTSCTEKHSKEGYTSIGVTVNDERSKAGISKELEYQDLHQHSKSCGCEVCAHRRESKRTESEVSLSQKKSEELKLPTPELSKPIEDFHRENMSCNCTICINKKIKAECQKEHVKDEGSKIIITENLNVHPRKERCNCRICIGERQDQKSENEPKQTEGSEVIVPEKLQHGGELHRESKSCNCKLCLDKKEREENERKQKLQVLLPPREDVSKRNCKCRTCAEKRRQQLKKPCSAPELLHEIPNCKESPKGSDNKVTFKKDEPGLSLEHHRQPQVHQQPRSCSICVDRAKCELPKANVCPKDTPISHKIETKSSTPSQILQHPRIPNAITNIPKREQPEICPCIRCDQVIQPPPRRAESEQIVRLKTSTATQLLQHPRIPARAQAGREDKVMHTYDCTCHICLDPSISKHPLEKEKKKPWKLPWCSKQQVELKPKPHPLEVKPWKVSDVFQHPRIPLVVDLNTEHKCTSRPPPEKCVCEKDKQEHKVVVTKSTKMVGLFRKPRVPLAIDSRNHCRNIFGEHEQDCHCVICEDRTKCKTEFECPKIESVEITSRNFIQLFQRPRIPNLVNDAEKSAPVKTKSSSIFTVCQHPRIAKIVLNKPALVPIEKDPNKSKTESCPCIKTCPKEPEEIPHDLKPHSVENVLLHHPGIPQHINYTPKIDTDKVCVRKRSCVQLFQRPRLSNAIGAKVPSFPQRKKVTSQPEICPCQEEAVKPEPIDIKRSSFSQIFQRPRIPFPIDKKPSKSTEAINVRSRGGTSIFQRPRVPMYEPTCSKYYQVEREKCCKCDKTAEPCQCDAKPQEDPTMPELQPVCDRPTKTEEIQRKPWYVSDILQRPRIPNATDDKPRSETGLPKVCPCSEEQSERKKAGSCFPSRVCHSKSEECKVETKPTNIANLFKKPRYTKPFPSMQEPFKDRCPQRKPESCPCIETCIERKCQDEPIQETVQTKHWNPSALMQHPRIPARIDVIQKHPSEKESVDETCPCIVGKEKNKWTKACDELLKIFETCRPPRIPNQIDTKEKVPHQKSGSTIREPIKKEDCPCVQSCPKSEEPMKPDPVLTKPFNIAALFQHPKIRSITFHPSGCSCTTCQEVSNCKPPAKAVPLEVRTRPCKMSNIMQRPRIPNAVDMLERKQHAKPETCPCQNHEEKHPVSTCKERKSGGTEVVDEVLTKPTNLANAFHHPRIPYYEKRPSECGCTACPEKPSPHEDNAPPQFVSVKPISPSRLFQHPRIPNTIDYKPLKEPTCYEPEACPCKTKETPKVFCPDSSQCPQIPQHQTSSLTQRSSEIHIKPRNIANHFQHPRIPFQEAPIRPPVCQCNVTTHPNRNECLKDPIKLRPSYIASLLQRPRIPTSISECSMQKPHKSESCPCPKTPKKKTITTNPINTKSVNPINLFQHPRIPQHCKPKLEKVPSCPWPIPKKIDQITQEPVQLKPSKLISMLQHPKIRFQAGYSTPKQECEPVEKCECTVCDVDKPFETVPKTCPSTRVETKSTNFTRVFQHPRIPTAIDQEPKHVPEKCPCLPERKPAGAGEKFEPVRIKHNSILNIYQKPRIPKQISTEAVCPCDSCQKSDEKPARETERIISKIVRTKPINVFSMFQHPRIPAQANIRPVTETSVKCPCSESDSIKAKPSKISQIYQHPKVAKPIGTKPDAIEDPSCPCQSKCLPPIHPVETKPFQREQLFQRPKLFFPVKSKENVECPCASQQSKKPRVKPKTVKTKPRYISTILQRPRILSAIDTRPLKEKCITQDTVETCPCTPKEEVPRICSGKENIRTKPVSTVNVFQHPRIPNNTNERERKDKDCVCSLEPKQSDICQIHKEPSSVHRKPTNWINICQHPRIPQGPENPKPPTKCECSIFENKPSCRPEKDAHKTGPLKTKTPSLASAFQHPRIPFLTGMKPPKQEKCSCGDNKQTILQRPKLSKHIERPDKSRSCPCDVCSQTVENEKSKVPKLSSMFQHPRIPNAIEHSCSYADHKDECTCCICQDRIPCKDQKGDHEACRLKNTMGARSKRATVKTKHWSMSSLLQHPRITPMDIKPIKTTMQGSCSCQSPEKRKSAGSNLRLSSTVKTKPNSFSSLYQKPRIPTQTDQFRETKCPCELCTKKPEKYKPKPPKTEQICTKSSGITSAFQHPRISFQSRFIPEPPPDQCSCSQAKETNFIRTKPLTISSMFQHPRIPNASGNWERKRKVCKCSICENRRICETIYGTSEYGAETPPRNNLCAENPKRVEPKYVANHIADVRRPLDSDYEIRGCKCNICRDKARCLKSNHSESEELGKLDKEVQTQENTRSCTCKNCKSEQSCPKNRFPAGSFTSVSNPVNKERMECSDKGDVHHTPKKTCSCKICKDRSICLNDQKKGEEYYCPAANQGTVKLEPDSAPTERPTHDKICDCSICKNKALCKEAKEKLPKKLIKHKIELKPKETKLPCTCNACKKGEPCLNQRKTAGGTKMDSHADRTPETSCNVLEKPPVYHEQIKASCTCTNCKAGGLCSRQGSNSTVKMPISSNEVTKKGPKEIVSTQHISGCQCNLCKDKSLCLKSKHQIDNNPEQRRENDQDLMINQPIIFDSVPKQTTILNDANCHAKSSSCNVHHIPKKTCSCKTCKNPSICLTYQEKRKENDCTKENLGTVKPKPDSTPIEKATHGKNCSCDICKSKAQSSEKEKELPEKLIKQKVELKPKESKKACECDTCNKGEPCLNQRKTAGGIKMDSHNDRTPETTCNMLEKPPVLTTTKIEEKVHHEQIKASCTCTNCKAAGLCPRQRSNSTVKMPISSNEVTQESPKKIVSTQHISGCQCKLCKDKSLCRKSKHQIDKNPKGRPENDQDTMINQPTIFDSVPKQTTILNDTNCHAKSSSCNVHHIPKKTCSCKTCKNPSICLTYQEKSKENDCIKENLGTVKPKPDSTPIEKAPHGKNCKCDICKSKAQSSEKEKELPKKLIKQKVELKPKESKKPCNCDACKEGEPCLNRRKTAGGDKMNSNIDKTPEANCDLSEKPPVVTATKKDEKVQREENKVSCTCTDCKTGGLCRRQRNNDKSNSAIKMSTSSNDVTKDNSINIISKEHKSGCQCNLCTNKSACLKSKHQIEISPEGKRDKNKDSTLSQPATITSVPKQNTNLNGANCHAKSCTCNECKNKSKCVSKKETKPTKLKADKKQQNPGELQKLCPCDPCKMKERCLYRRQNAGEFKTDTKSSDIGSHQKENLSSSKPQDCNKQADELAGKQEDKIFAKPVSQVKPQVTFGDSKKSEKNSEKHQACNCTVCQSGGQCLNSKLGTNELEDQSYTKESQVKTTGEKKEAEAGRECLPTDESITLQNSTSNPLCKCSSCKNRSCSKKKGDLTASSENHEAKNKPILNTDIKESDHHAHSENSFTCQQVVASKISKVTETDRHNAGQQSELISSSCSKPGSSNSCQNKTVCSKKDQNNDFLFQSKVSTISKTKCKLHKCETGDPCRSQFSGDINDFEAPDALQPRLENSSTKSTEQVKCKDVAKNCKDKLACSKATKSNANVEYATRNTQENPNKIDGKPSCSCNNCKNGDKCLNLKPNFNPNSKQPSVEKSKEHLVPAITSENLAPSKTSNQKLINGHQTCNCSSCKSGQPCLNKLHTGLKAEEPKIPETSHPNLTSANPKKCTCIKCKNKGNCPNLRKNAGSQLNTIPEEKNKHIADATKSVQPNKEAMVDVGAPKPNCQCSICKSGKKCTTARKNTSETVLLDPKNNATTLADKEVLKPTDSCKTGTSKNDCQNSCISNQCSKTKKGPVHSMDNPAATPASISEKLTTETSSKRDCTCTSCKDKGHCHGTPPSSSSIKKADAQTVAKPETESVPRQDSARAIEYQAPMCKCNKCTSGSKCKKVQINTDQNKPDVISCKNEVDERTRGDSEPYSNAKEAARNCSSAHCTKNALCSNKNCDENHEPQNRIESPELGIAPTENKHCRCPKCQNKIMCVSKKKKKWRFFG